MRCVVCGVELMNGLDTFGDEYQPMCWVCEWGCIDEGYFGPPPRKGGGGELDMERNERKEPRERTEQERLV